MQNGLHQPCTSLPTPDQRTSRKTFLSKILLSNKFTALAKAGFIHWCPNPNIGSKRNWESRCKEWRRHIQDNQLNVRCNFAACLDCGDIAVQIVRALGVMDIHLGPLRKVSSIGLRTLKHAVDCVRETQWMELLKESSVRTSWASIERELRQASEEMPTTPAIKDYYEHLAKKSFLPKVSLTPEMPFVKAVQKVFRDEAARTLVCPETPDDFLKNSICWTDYDRTLEHHTDWQTFAALECWKDTDAEGKAEVEAEIADEIQCWAIIERLVPHTLRWL